MKCPTTITSHKTFTLAHGGGGKLTHNLINNIIIRELNGIYQNTEHDGAIIYPEGKIAFTTDSFVVQPIFFKGGDIGKLAVYGTVNDLACCGAEPKYISLSFIIEEGFLIEDFIRILRSIKEASQKADIKIVTGDTKVVEKGKGDKIFINTSGIGIVFPNANIDPKNCKPGQKIIINGSIAEHGISILSMREELEFDTNIKSDCAPLNKLVKKIFEVSDKIRVLRDPTRGGLSSALNEIASSSGHGITIYENEIPIQEQVNGVCEIFGFDPLYVANEGKILVFVDEEDTQKVLDTMKSCEFGEYSKIIGEVHNNNNYVQLKTSLGTSRIIDMISGEQLPRIC